MTANNYDDLVEAKTRVPGNTGFAVSLASVNDLLFPFQKHCVQWSVGKGRAALFEDVGLGKTLQQIEWARLIHEYSGGDVLILAPPAVAPQTIREAEKIGVEVVRSRDGRPKGPVTITNYEQLEKFNPTDFAGIVADEGSILKSYMGAIKRALVEFARDIDYRLLCTATPAPNDYLELGNSAEWLGVMKSSEMISRFFINDSMQAGAYRLKAHAERAFWHWMSGWAVAIGHPRDMGFQQDGYDLPALRFVEVDVSTEGLPPAEGELFRNPEMSATSFHREGRATAERKAQAISELVLHENPFDPWVIWVQTNYQADEVMRMIPEAVDVRGSESLNAKESKLDAFSRGETRVIVTKPDIAGFGLNWQHCAHVAYVPDFSYEKLYQAVGRSHRFGQDREVNVHMIVADSEGSLVSTLKRKREQHMNMKSQMCELVSREHASDETPPEFSFDRADGPGWALYHGDCVKFLRDFRDGETKDLQIDFSMFSPPFSNLYIYSDDPHDMGNTDDDAHFFEQFGFLAAELLKATRPGRLCAIHCKDLPMYMNRDGAAGLRDFPGDCVRTFSAAGWTYHSRFGIWKDPVIEMQRTKNKGLLHMNACKDSAQLRQGMPDYVVVMRKNMPGEEVPVTAGNMNARFYNYEGTFPPTHAEYGTRLTQAERERQYSIAVWQRYAGPFWFDINQTDVLNIRAARDPEDEKHICPLQLGVIRRCVDLWSNPGDLVFSPFAGIGSEGHVAIEMDRRFMGVELKRSYWESARRTLAGAHTRQLDLFQSAG